MVMEGDEGAKSKEQTYCILESEMKTTPENTRNIKVSQLNFCII